MNNIFRLEKKKILITGASSGIGKSAAIKCSEMGAEIFSTARNEKRLNETKSLINTNSFTYIADLAIEEDICSLAKQLPELDGIVLNAGIVHIVPVKYIKKEALDKIFNVNVLGSIFLIKQLIKLKKIKNNASICFISSVASQKMTVGNAMYSATKGAINSFTKSLALELASKQIRVNAILPGMVETDILKKGSITDDNLKNHLKNYPIGRFGKPDDIANLLVFLMSDASSWMTGSLLTLDGGYSLK